ncbi:hypothetical protein GCM10014715_20890 [Streptomyces spiralis]|uniref:Uncharacterized protein n=1 Tax=Streptomyces spiralis TaxID=66376 RepID=A0A919DQ83_9ACTN|nr:hypothetical protein GCM10014715_20890 [Streptomyces spiralis]
MAAVRGAGAARELSVSCLAGSVHLVAYGLAKVFWSVRCPTQVAPEYEGGASTSVPTEPSLSRRLRGGSVGAPY